MVSLYKKVCSKHVGRNDWSPLKRKVCRKLLGRNDWSSLYRKVFRKRVGRNDWSLLVLPGFSMGALIGSDLIVQCRVARYSLVLCLLLRITCYRTIKEIHQCTVQFVSMQYITKHHSAIEYSSVECNPGSGRSVDR